MNGPKLGRPLDVRGGLAEWDRASCFEFHKPRKLDAKKLTDYIRCKSIIFTGAPEYEVERHASNVMANEIAKAFPQSELRDGRLEKIVNTFVNKY